MKKYIDIGVYDFSDYAEEITWDALFKINGGAQIENSIEAQEMLRLGIQLPGKMEQHIHYTRVI